ncbi:ribokinase [Aureimonas sp. Leaf324]|jgi:ribokinase|uniref:ribokinase n=1 Tax=Aureimonas sp. Leaf324 TaxID=1736336 RepID=UPI0006FA0F3F|nr:ribokinase [Aureimonas sp. Leaf324]KQQ89412.1 ribokinase [Aureimonas sp. Leaf324]
MSHKIAVVGSNMMDLVTYVTRMPAPGETLEAPSFEMGHGGKGANQAVAAARLGSQVVMVTKVGDDAFADATIRNFEANGIDTAHVTRVPGVSSGVAPIFVEPSGENSILIVQGANAHLSPGDVDAAAEALKGCDLILMQMEVAPETVYHTVAWGQANGVKTLLNPAPAAADLDVSKIAAVSFLAPNETELAILSGMPVTDETQAEAAARSLIAKGVGTVIVTMGSRGALLVEAAQTRRIEPVSVTPVDTTGAGDAFIGAFAHFHASGEPVFDALRKAAAYAADSVTRRGTQKSYARAADFAALQEA